MKRLRFLMATAWLLSASAILIVSLFAFTPVYSTGGSAKQVYFSEQILPDHLAYPVLMAIDRVKLESASRAERIYIQTDYAQRRIEYAQALVEKDEQELAMTTLTKALKYVVHAAVEAQELDNPTLDKHILKTIDFQKQVVSGMLESFDRVDKSSVDRLFAELDILKSSLSAE